MSNQSQINYVNDAQLRVAADTLCYEQKAQIVVDTTGIAQLRSDVIRIVGLYNGAEQLFASSEDDLLAFLSSGRHATGTLSYTLIGRQLYVWPKPTELVLLTAIYKARPPAAESDQPLSVTAQFEALVDQLTQATIMLDGGQTNAAAAALADYATQAARLRRRAGAKPGGSGRVKRVGQRMKRR